MILVLDNRDSFVFNLVQALQTQGAAVEVLRAAAVTPAEVVSRDPAGVLIGPGPGTPDRAGCSEAVARALAGRVPVLGLCLGHQAIATAFGGAVRRSDDLAHGQTRPVEHDGRGLFAGLPSPFEVVRYNSLAVDEARLPDELEVSARTPGGEVMGLRHRAHALEGVQFHPEAARSTWGERLFANFLAACGAARRPSSG